MSVDRSVNDNRKIRSTYHISKQVLSCSKTFVKRLIIRKEMGSLETEISTEHRLRPGALNLIQLIAIGLGSTIGTGIFVLSGQAAAKYAGPSVIISFIIASILALLSALSYAEMASLMSSSGSAFTYTYVALGEYPAFMIGWLSTVLYLLGASAVIVDWSHYVVNFIDLISGYNATKEIVQAPVAWIEDSASFSVTGQVINLPSIGITIAITIILIIGIRTTAIINLVFVVLKIVVLLIFIFACCIYVNRSNYDPFFPSNQGSFSQYGVTGMLQGTTYVFFAYIGFDSITAAAKEAKLPTQSGPRAIIITMIVTIPFYIGICTVMVGLVPYKTLDSDNPLVVAIKATPYGLWLSIILNLGAIASLTTVAITVLLAQTRIFYSLALDSLLPSIFAKVHSCTKTPWVAILVSGIICGILSGICPIDILGELVSFGALITYLFVHICVIVIRYTRKDLISPFRVPFGSWLIPTVGALLCILLLINTSKGTGIRFGVWMATGHIVYFSYSFWHSKMRSRERIEASNSITELLPTVEATFVNLTKQDSKPQIDEEAVETDA